MPISQEFHQEFTDLYTGYPHERAARGWIQGTRFQRYKQRNVMKIINPKPGDVILECGSSSGKLTVDAGMRGAKVYGVDLDPNAIEVGEALLRLYPEAKGKVTFQQGDLTEMDFASDINKVLLIDFTEHLRDDFFIKMLENFKRTIPSFQLFIYTPNRTHLFEYLRSKNWLLKENKTHIGLRTMDEYQHILTAHGYKLLEAYHLASHVPVYRQLETVLSWLPVVGHYFRRRVCITAEFRG